LFGSRAGNLLRGVSMSPWARDLFLPVHHVRALLERGGETRKRRIEHRTHQHGQHPAPELVGDEKADVAGVLAFRLEGPAVFEVRERSPEITDADLQVRAVERHLAG